MPTPKSLYADALNEISKRYGHLDHQTVRRLIELLQETRKSIALQLLQSPTDFEVFRLSQLRDNIDIIVKRFQLQFGDSLTKALVDAHGLGVAGVTDPLNAIGLNVGTFNTIPTAQLNVVLDFSAELIQNIGDDLRKTINTQLRLSTLAQQTPFQAMKAVTNAMGSGVGDEHIKKSTVNESPASRSTLEPRSYHPIRGSTSPVVVSL